MSDIADFIARVGFPVFVALYVLMRLEPTIKGLEKTINVLTYVMAKSNGVDFDEAQEIAGHCKK